LPPWTTSKSCFKSTSPRCSPHASPARTPKPESWLAGAFFIYRSSHRSERTAAASVRSYRDTIRLFLLFVASSNGRKLTRLGLGNFTFEQVIAFLRYLEQERGNHIRTRNQRLAALHVLFEYIATRAPEMLDVCQRVMAIPMKRVAPAPTSFLERHEMEDLLRHLPRHGPLALRDKTLLLFLYNTGARVQEGAGVRVGHLDFGEHPRVRLHCKGDKWRIRPLWGQTAELLRVLLASFDQPLVAQSPVFSGNGRPLTQSGIYKIVRRHGARFDNPSSQTRISPHVLRYTCAVHLVESGVQINLIQGWLGHADLTATNRYAQINTK
jgi:integrase/recombinase XerD